MSLPAPVPAWASSMHRVFSPVPALEDALQILRALPAPTAPLRVDVPLLTPVDPLRWLLHQPPGQRLYWSGRDGGLSLAGWGVAAALPLPEGLSAAAVQGGWRWLGGMAFDPSAPLPDEWAPLGAGALLAPALLVAPDRVTLQILPDQPIRLPAAQPPPVQAWTWLQRQEEPSVDGWRETIRAATGALRSGALRKVVLSRRTRLTFAVPPDPVALLARLAAVQHDTFDFVFEVAPGHAVLGCSPERLFRRHGRQVETEALAGTCPRFSDPHQDAAAGDALRSSPKDQEEHQHVVAALETALAPLCDQVAHPVAPALRRLHRVQHLHTPFSAVLREGVDDAALLGALHPTPAVCGAPQDRARQQIRAWEPFGRGWYAGPVGWVDAEGAEFAVAIRSALLSGTSLWVCAGAGIVAASDADAEWRELEAKSAQFFALFGEE